MGKGLRYEQRRLNQHDRRPNPVCIPCRRCRRIYRPGQPRRSPADRPATALPVRHHGCRMGRPGPARAGRDRTRPADHLPPPGRGGRDPPPRPDGLPVGCAARRFPPLQAPALLRPVPSRHSWNSQDDRCVPTDYRLVFRSNSRLSRGPMLNQALMASLAAALPS